MRTRDEVVAVLEPLDRLEAREYSLSGSVEFTVSDDGVRMHAGGDDLGVTRAAFEDAFRKVPGLSKAAINDWPVELLLPPVNWFMQNRSGDAITALVDPAEDEVVTFARSHSVPLLRSLEGIEELLAARGVSDLQYDKIWAGLDRSCVALVSPSRSVEVKPGDSVSGGLMLTGSTTGRYPVEVAAYVNRLVCSNGMISPVNLATYQSSGALSASEFDSWLVESVESAWSGVEDEFAAVRSLTEIPVDGHSSDVLRDVFQRHRVPVRVRAAVQDALVEEHDGTMFGVAQAFNRAANAAEDIGSMRHLLLVAGEVAHQTERCSACMRALN